MLFIRVLIYSWALLVLFVLFCLFYSYVVCVRMFLFVGPCLLVLCCSSIVFHLSALLCGFCFAGFCLLCFAGVLCSAFDASRCSALLCWFGLMLRVALLCFAA